ncbi:radical SAM/SPASM domain-containing protein [Paenibacillus donghaensis]|uniref:Radical SAM core domain-containing protein n=1 Tax=Paenibacillus donghaensis TaxID=414771 RepID=A0A2Z2KDX4_9BACL|nr:radical SAM protein [Paenibacillus donghaensis]ASA20199.1 hypothetical protein B9T62_04920 [Paenibacillus donghaensis]
MKEFFVIPSENYDIVYHSSSHKVYKLNSSARMKLQDEAVFAALPAQPTLPELLEMPMNEHKKPSINFMSSRTCNLGCKYCFAGEGEYSSSEIKPKFIAPDIYAKTLDSMIAKYPQGLEYISFFGGEPLLDFKTIKETVLLTENKFEQAGIPLPRICISTNGMLFREPVLEFVKEHRIEVGLSLDGPKALNDLGRTCKGKDKNRISVYDQVLQVAAQLREHQIDYKVQITLNKHHINAYREGIVKEWFDEMGDVIKTNITVCPVTTDDPEFQISGERDYAILDLMAREMVHYYYKEYSKDHPERLASIFVSPMVFILNGKVARSCAAGESMVLVDTDGAVYPCQMYCNNDEYLLGSVQTDYQMLTTNNNTYKRIHNDPCSECIAQNLCAMWCKGLQLMTHGEESHVLPERCVFQKAVVEENIKLLAQIKTQKDSTSSKLIGKLYESLKVRS